MEHFLLSTFTVPLLTWSNRTNGTFCNSIFDTKTVSTIEL